jgi:hypothetical protein
MAGHADTGRRVRPSRADRTGVAFGNPADFVEARAEAERTTAAIMTRYVGVLSADERSDFGEIVETTRNAIEM